MSVLLVSSLTHSRLTTGRSIRVLAAAFVTTFVLFGTAKAQPPAPQNFASAVDLIPHTAAGVVRIPSLPEFCVSWRKTKLGELMKEPLMQPFLDAQRERTTSFIESMDTRVGLRPQDLYDIASGEVVAAWLPFEKDQRRPFSLCVVADVRGRDQATETTLAKIDQDLKAGGATRVDSTHREQTVRVYTTKPKPGQLKIDQVAITANASRVIASDRDTVIFGILDAIAGEPKEEAISSVAQFQTIMNRSRESLQGSDAGSLTTSLEWFARPFPMARIIRKSVKVDRGNQVDILRLLETQGFDAVQAVGGAIGFAGTTFDLVHRGYVLAPPTLESAARYAKAGAMLQLFNEELKPIPTWVHADAAKFSRLNWDLAQAVWASESLINEAFGDDIFRPMLEGIRDDEEGPQIDIEKNVLPNLDKEILLITDNTAPATIDSERMLVAIKVKDANAIRLAIQKAMEVEPDASKLDAVPGVDIWRVERTGESDDFDAEFLNDLGFGEDARQDSQPPLLEHWAIALVGQGPGSPDSYLMFSSHSDLLVLAAKRVQSGEQGGFGSLGVTEEIIAAMKQLGAKSVGYERITRTDLNIRAKYELLRQGKLKESDSVLSSIVRRVFEDQDPDDEDPINGALLPPMDQIQKYLRPGGGFIEMLPDGMSITGFFLK